LCASASADETPLFTSPLPTGVRLDPAGDAVDLSSLPINLVLAPEHQGACETYTKCMIGDKIARKINGRGDRI
jgi:hypothetical protein